MQEEGRWARLDEHLPRDLRAYLEDHFWRPIEAQATLEVLLADPLFFEDPGRLSAGGSSRRTALPQRISTTSGWWT